MKTSDEFRTPPWLFKELDETLGPFFWDTCCTWDNCLMHNENGTMREPQQYYLDDNGHRNYDYLEIDLQEIVSKYEIPNADTVFMNPPYSNPLPFIKKAWEDSNHFRVVMLLKADMSTKWFNYALDEAKTYNFLKPVTIITKDVLQDAKFGFHCDNNPDYAEVTIIPLRKRVKFYVSEEVLEQDINAQLKNGETYLDKYDVWMDGCKLLETKNYKRVDDGIVSKSSANFPSMIMIFDRRE